MSCAIDEKRLKKLKENASTIKYSSDPSLIKQADYVIICVPTPVHETKEPDMSFVESASRTAGRNL
ncbi:MAG: hypothetical protein WAX07_10105 [Candidatus Altiarchaeia archaeon]